MARQRMLNPMFFIDPDIAMLSPWARLLFQSLWCLADREGRLEDKPQRIRVQTFPFDKDVNIDGHLSELAEQDFIQRYVVNGKAYIQIRSFIAHQRPHPKEAASAIPPCPAVPCHVEPCNYTEGIAQPVGIRNTESKSDTESESVTESVSVPQSVSSEPAVDVRESPEPVLPPIEAYGAQIVEEWHKARGSEFPQPSNRDFQQLCDWHGSGIPLRIVVRGIQDCIETMRRRGDKPAGKTLAYYNSAVRHAHGQWHKALA